MRGTAELTQGASEGELLLLQTPSLCQSFCCIALLPLAQYYHPTHISNLNTHYASYSQFCLAVFTHTQDFSAFTTLMIKLPTKLWPLRTDKVGERKHYLLLLKQYFGYC